MPWGSMKRVILSPHAPTPLGPYSQAVVSNHLVFCSGQLGIDCMTGKLIQESISEEARQALSNLKALLEDAGSSLDRVLKVTIFMTYLPDLKKINEVYREFFSEDLPSRSAVGVAQLPLGARIEIEAIASLE